MPEVVEDTSVSYYIYGEDVNYLQILMKKNGNVVALDQAVVSCGKGAACHPLPMPTSSLLDKMFSFPNNLECGSYTLWVNKKEQPVSLALSPPQPGNIVMLDISSPGAVYLMPGVLLCTDSKLEYNRQTKFGYRSGHPCRRLMRISGASKAFIGAGGQALEKNLEESEVLYVSERCLLGFHESCTVNWPVSSAIYQYFQAVRGGPRMVEIRGPGMVYTQSTKLTPQPINSQDLYLSSSSRSISMLIVLIAFFMFLLMADMWLESFLQNEVNGLN